MKWLTARNLFLMVLGLTFLGLNFSWWRSTGVGPQVQVPMFYDSHYAFHRPWTQIQAAPGVPPPAPLALYGQNQASQTFKSGSGRFGMIKIWLGGRVNNAQIWLTDQDNHRYLHVTSGELAGDRYHYFAFPTADDPKGATYTFTVMAPEATADDPLLVQTVGGDRLGASMRLNEYQRPGNLALYTYSRGWIGRWWVDAQLAQWLPTPFLLRIQQYKPLFFKGASFPVLLLLTGLMAAAVLVLSWPMTPERRFRSGWSVLAVLLTAVLVWQLVSGRLHLFPPVQEFNAEQNENEAVFSQPTLDNEQHLVEDFSAILWTAGRLPEERFFTTQTAPNSNGIVVPGQSQLSYNLAIPFNGRFRFAPQAMRTETAFQVFAQNDLLYETLALPADEHALVELDLSVYGGQTINLRLVTTADVPDQAPAAVWHQPQIVAARDWLSAPLTTDPISIFTHPNMSGEVGLHEVIINKNNPAENEVVINIQWQLISAVDAYPTVFVHLRDQSGQIVAQSDSPPVQGTYPVANWPADFVINDTHRLTLPADLPSGDYSIAVGLYQPDTRDRWTAVDEEGAALADQQVISPVFLRID
ncbi:MAG: hypothetical protein QNJ45_08025 [Ardenticatenaceae bacterium]|nr:hypothetical protein [Ardenticatenaceae bacterium]